MRLSRRLHVAEFVGDNGFDVLVIQSLRDGSRPRRLDERCRRFPVQSAREQDSATSLRESAKTCRDRTLGPSFSGTAWRTILEMRRHRPIQMNSTMTDPQSQIAEQDRQQMLGRLGRRRGRDLRVVRVDSFGERFGEFFDGGVADGSGRADRAGPQDGSQRRSARKKAAEFHRSRQPEPVACACTVLSKGQREQRGRARRNVDCPEMIADSRREASQACLRKFSIVSIFPSVELSAEVFLPLLHRRE